MRTDFVGERGRRDSLYEKAGVRDPSVCLQVVHPLSLSMIG